MNFVDRDIKNRKIQAALQLLDDNDLFIICTALASQIRRYDYFDWNKDKELQEIYERMQVIHRTLNKLSM